VNTLKSCDSGLSALHIFKHQNKTYLLSGDWCGELNLWCLDDDNKLVKTLCSNHGVVRSLATFEYNKDLLIAAGVDEPFMSNGSAQP